MVIILQTKESISERQKALPMERCVMPNNTCSFPDDPAISFAKARFECLRGNLQVAHDHWMRALTAAKTLGTERHWKRQALLNPDLQPLWNADSLDAVEVA